MSSLLKGHKVWCETDGLGARSEEKGPGNLRKPIQSTDKAVIYVEMGKAQF